MSSWKVFPSSNFQIAINYSSPFITPQGKIDGFNSVDISWKQMIMKEKASITFSVNDFFNTRQFHVRGNEQFVSYDFVRKRQSRVANLTFTYNFGALELKSTRRKTPDIPRNDDGGGF